MLLFIWDKVSKTNFGLPLNFVLFGKCFEIMSSHSFTPQNCVPSPKLELRLKKEKSKCSICCFLSILFILFHFSTFHVIRIPPSTSPSSFPISSPQLFSSINIIAFWQVASPTFCYLKCFMTV